jgi:DNA-binding MarR family transcriptional regulator
VHGGRAHMTEQAARFDLTLPQAHPLRLLELGPARTMPSVAEALSCDAWNVTGVVDPLEARRLSNRGSPEHDRRIETIAVTRKGTEVIRELSRAMFAPPDALRRLTKKQLTAFHALMALAFGEPKMSRTTKHRPDGGQSQPSRSRPKSVAAPHTPATTSSSTMP